ncbi:MAG: SDR family NAD(P)-dependent oxidoreductase [Theionarchaea archaeon]|nr:SDR family NAD(P)-dependent oxidoreductase [Theionarchaea archaeon]
MTTVLVTGAFGSIGSFTTKKLLELNYNVVAFDLLTPKTEKISRQFKNIIIYWGDITNKESLKKVLEKEPIDGVIHLAFIIPPLTEKLEIAEKVNIGGTQTLITLLEESQFQGPLVFSSSVSVFGETSRETPPISSDHPVKATDVYTEHKIRCETMLKESALDWRILRYSGVIVPGLFDTNELEVAFQIPLDTRVEPVHVEDVATATVNALFSKKASRRILIIAGGPKNQVYWKDFLVKTFQLYIGEITVDDLPQEKFSKKPYYLDWYDTITSQEILEYQNHTIEDYIQDSYNLLGMKKVLFRLLRPLIKRKIF